MKKLAIIGMTLCCAMAGTLISGCSKSNRDRVKEAIAVLEPDAGKQERAMKEFDEVSAEEQLFMADMVEYMVLLKKQSRGMLKGEQLKTTARKTMEGLSARKREELLAEIKANIAVGE